MGVSPLAPAVKWNFVVLQQGDLELQQARERKREGGREREREREREEREKGTENTVLKSAKS